LDEIEELYSGTINEYLQTELSLTAELDEAQDDLDLILDPPEEPEEPPGPPCLKWIMTEYFNCVATLVIITNIVCMVLELITPALAQKFFWLDQGFMLFYILEIALKVILLQHGFLFGPISFVAWNWLDSIIVFSGCLDMYLQPMLVWMGIIQGGHSLKFLSFLRMLRLLRILKIVGMFMKADLSWTQKERFQVFIMGVIGFNSLLMGMESDFPSFFMWFYIEQLLLVIFSFELATRLKHFGCEFFYHKTDIGWNLLDFTIVVGGIIDQWMMPTIAFIKFLMGEKQGGSGNLGQVMMMLRMARLLRILRLVRLVKNIPPLYTLVVGIVQAMQGMMWVLVLTFVLLYAFALLGVKLVGHGLAFPGSDGAPEDVMCVFPSVFDSMFVLFKAMNGDWSALTPLFHVLPITKILFFMYTVISAWGLLSILTAVVSENMINATEEHREEQEKEEQKLAVQQKEIELKRLFKDHCGADNKIDKKEFDKMIEDKETRGDLLAVSGLEEWELKDIFKYLSKVDDMGTRCIELKDFIEGLKSEGRKVSNRTISRLEHRIGDFEQIIRTMTQAVLSQDHPDPDVGEFVKGKGLLYKEESERIKKKTHEAKQKMAQKKRDSDASSSIRRMHPVGSRVG
jgi:voltage-gated sodium channel